VEHEGTYKDWFTSVFDDVGDAHQAEL